MADQDASHGQTGFDMAQMSPADAQEMMANMSQVFERGARLWETALAEQMKDPTHSPAAQAFDPTKLDPMNAAGAMGEMFRSMMTHPAETAESALSFWTDQAELWRRAGLKAVGQEVEPVATPEPGDKRFKDPEWSENAVFDAIKQSYLLTAQYLTRQAEASGQDLTSYDRRKVAFTTRQIVEAISPTNYFALNPEVLRTTFEEKGQNLVRGLEHMIEDLERGHGELRIRQTDLDKFKIGENVAVSPGKVIFRNDVMELIQYAPATEQVRRRPIVMCPPWINKFYILDLNPKKSLVKWLVEQGHTVFMISWVNAGAKQSDKEFVDYIAEGLFEGVAHAIEETGSEDVDLASYCIGGTMTSTALAFLAASPDHPLHGRIASATFFTAQFDFSDAGELQLFVDDMQLAAIDDQMEEGVLKADRMSNAFNMLRSSDLIWGFVINNYMLGKEPFPFDLLFWNSDSTNMPAPTLHYYLERFYRDNALADGKLTLGHVKLDLGKIDTPSFHVATKEDHIAPAASVYRGVQMLGGDRTMVLAGSGHIAGVVNPPASQKYQYWMRDDAAWPATVEAWRDGAKETAGSWWPFWDAWLRVLPGGADMAPAREPGERHGTIADAPGDYVRVSFDAA